MRRRRGGEEEGIDSEGQKGPPLSPKHAPTQTGEGIEKPQLALDTQSWAYGVAHVQGSAVCLSACCSALFLAASNWKQDAEPENRQQIEAFRFIPTLLFFKV